MAKINDIIREMEALLDGADLSNTPQGRQLAISYAEICQELNSALEECRVMFNMGAYSEARRLNQHAQPPLTDRWSILNFPRRDEWIQLCALYNWSVPPEFDTELINKLLNKGESDVEISIEELQNQWRRIIRDGSLYQKLILARKIHALDPTNKTAYSNLVNVERPWLNQLKKEADAALEEKREEDLAAIFQDLTSPELCTKIPSGDLKKYHPMIDAYNKAKLQKEKEQLLELIASCYAAMLLDELENALSEWAQLEKNPLFSITSDEKLQIDDARNFFREQQSIINENERFESLEHELEFLLNEEKAKPSEIDSVYHQLQMFDRPIKTILEERINDFHERVELDTKRRHVRKCVHWVCGILAAAGLIFASIYLVQQELELRRDAKNIRELLTARDFEEALKYCDEIGRERPLIAKRAMIVALRTETENSLKDAQAAEKIFNETCEDLEKNYLTEEKVLDPVVDERFALLEEKAKFLTVKKSVAKDELRSKYQTLREAIFLKNEGVFLREVRKLQNQWSSLNSTVEDFSESDFSAKADQLRQESNQLLNRFEKKVSDAVFKEQKKNFAYHDKRSRENLRELQQLLADSYQLYNPESLSSYADALKKIRNKSTRISGFFAEIYDQIDREMVVYNLPGNYDGYYGVIGSHQIKPIFRDMKTAGKPQIFNSSQNRDFVKNFSDLRSRILEKEYRLHELRFTSDGKLFHFYFPEPKKNIEIDWDWTHTRIKAINFRFVCNVQGMSTDAIFRVKIPKKLRSKPMNEQLAEMTLDFVDGQKFTALPKNLKMVDPGALLRLNSIAYSSHYQVLKGILDGMSGVPGYADIMLAIVSAAENKEITNVYAKVHLLKSLCKLLPIKDNLFYQQLAPLEKLLDEYSNSGEKERWMDPTATFKNADPAGFQKKLDQLKLREIFGSIRMNELLLEAACKRIPNVIGVMYRDKKAGKTEWRLHRLKNGLSASEVFVQYFPEGEKGKRLYNCAFLAESFSMPVAHDKLPDGLKNVLYNGQLVFAAPNIESCNDDLLRICQDIKAAGFVCPTDNSTIIWPESWPLNRRKLPESDR